MTTTPHPFELVVSLHERRRFRASLGVAMAWLGGALALGCRHQTGPTTLEHCVESHPVVVSGM